MKRADPPGLADVRSPRIGLEPLLDPSRLQGSLEVVARKTFTLWDCMHAGRLAMLGHRCDLQAGTLVLIPAGVAARFEPSAPDATACEVQFRLRIDDDGLEDARDRVDAREMAVTIPGIPTLALITPPRGGLIGERFLKTARLNKDPALKQIEMMWHLASALRHLASAYGRQRGRPLQTRNVAHMAASFLYQHQSDPTLSLDDVAAFVGVSKPHLARLFRKEYQTSPMRLLLEERMARARHILESPNFTISEVAELTGYASRELFSRTFKTEHGVSPREYRLALRPRRDPWQSD